LERRRIGNARRHFFFGIVGVASMQISVPRKNLKVSAIINCKWYYTHWGDLGVDGWILGWIFRRWDVGIWTGLGWPRIETGGGHL